MSQDRVTPNIENLLEAFAITANRVSAGVLGRGADGTAPDLDYSDVSLLATLAAAVQAIGSEFARGLTAQQVNAAMGVHDRRIVQ